MSQLIKKTNDWENPKFSTLVIGFDPKVDRTMQETLYQAFPEDWKKRASEMPHANKDFKLFKKEKDGFIKLAIHVQLSTVEKPSRYKWKSNTDTVRIWQIRMDNP